MKNTIGKKTLIIDGIMGTQIQNLNYVWKDMLKIIVSNKINIANIISIFSSFKIFDISLLMFSIIYGITFLFVYLTISLIEIEKPIYGITSFILIIMVFLTVFIVSFDATLIYKAYHISLSIAGLLSLILYLIGIIFFQYKLEKIYMAEDLTIAHQLKEYLSDNGINVIVKPRNKSNTFSDSIHLQKANLLVKSNQDKNRVKILIEEALLKLDNRDGWKCSICNEKSEEQFDNCWKCGTKRLKG